MKNKLIKTMIAILVIELVLFSGSIFGGNTIGKMVDGYLNSLDNRVLVRKTELQEEKFDRWLNLEGFEAHIQDEYKNSGASENIKLRKPMLENVAEDAIGQMRQNGVTEIFVILDGEEDKEGFHFRNLDPLFNASNHTDILMERGSIDIAKKLGIGLDSKWTNRVNLEREDENSKYYYKPYEAAKANPDMLAEDLGYLSKPFKLSPEDVEIMTYSMPLIDERGEVYGVIGVGMTTDFISRQLRFDELAKDKKGSYILGTYNPEMDRYERTVAAGPISNTNIDREDLECEKVNNKNIYRINEHDKIDGNIYLSIHDLDIYNKNTPFKDQKWGLIGLVEEKYLLSPISSIVRSILVSLAISSVVGLAAIYIAGDLFMKPIDLLIENLDRSDPNEAYEHKETGVEEIDKVGIAIETLNTRVLDSASRVSQIINMMSLPIGTFEYREKDEEAFCTNDFFRVLGFEDSKECKYIKKSELIEILDDIKKHPEEDLENIYAYKKANGKNTWIELRMQEGEDRVLGLIEDVKDQVLTKRRMEYERDHDTLTYLLNRRAFARTVEEMMAKEDLGVSALVMWDLDNLKYVNDTYGHEYGDMYIQKTANTLREFRRYNTVIARMSGDEFFIFIHNYDNKQQVRDIIWEMEKTLYNTYIDLPGETEMRIRVSGGLAWYPDDSIYYHELVRFADFAMYEVKNSEKGSVGEFNKETYNRDSILLHGKEELNYFIDKALVKYAYQPIVNTKTGEVFAYEALMRPQTKRLKSPYDVIRLAQSQSKIYEIEKLTFFEVLRSYEELEDEFQGAKLFINSMANNILSEEDLKKFEEEFSDHLDKIVIEITESEQSNAEYTKKKQAVVKKWGSNLALDDFGSGYNSELSLLTLDPEFVKIDRNIIAGIDKDKNRQKLLSNILSYANNRDISIIAEGVENKEEMKILVGYGVRYMQGYYLGRPDLEIKDIDDKIKEEIRFFNREIEKEEI